VGGRIGLTLVRLDLGQPDRDPVDGEHGTDQVWSHQASRSVEVHATSVPSAR